MVILQQKQIDTFYTLFIVGEFLINQEGVGTCNLLEVLRYIYIFEAILYTPILLDGASATIRNFGQNDANRSRNGKSVVEAQ